MKNKVKTRFETGYTYNHLESPGEINNEPSLTVPDMSNTIQELLSRYTRLNEYQVGASYDGDDVDFDDPVMSNKNFDLLDIQDKQQELDQHMSWIEELKKQKAQTNKGSRGTPPGTSSSTENVESSKEAV